MDTLLLTREATARLAGAAALNAEAELLHGDCGRAGVCETRNRRSGNFLVRRSGAADLRRARVSPDRDEHKEGKKAAHLLRLCGDCVCPRRALRPRNSDCN